MIAIPMKTTPFDAASTPSAPALVAFGQRLWRALEQIGMRRAERELRERAATYAATSPSMAADLMAAADFCAASR